MRKGIASALLLAALASAGCGGGGRAVAMRMRYSRYLPAAINVSAGQTVDFTLVNADPITHEFIIGTEAEQLAHERGDPHDPHTGPGQALLAGGATTHLRYTFHSPGTLLFACHRAGHYAFGMRGTITIKA